jgi:hypothetical protein
MFGAALLLTTLLLTVAQFSGGGSAAFRAAREAEVARLAARFASLQPRLPLRIRLDDDYVSAATSRHSIEVVDDCGEELCGVATDDFPEDWQIAEVRAMLTPASASRMQRDAFAVALLGTFHGQDVDRWAAACVGAGVEASEDVLVAVPMLAAKMRVADPAHRLPFAEVLAKAGGVSIAPSRPMRAAPIQANFHGATFSLTNRIDKSTLSPGAAEELKRLRGLGYDAISLIPFAGQRGTDGTELRRFAGSPASETDLAMRVAALRAQRLGMRVVLKPHVWCWPGGDPTKIDPGAAGWPRWFASYETFLVHEALLARAMHADWLAVGTELSRSESRPEWLPLIAKARLLFPGALTYAANFDAFERTPFWSALDAVGIDAYFPLSAKRDATDGELRAGARDVVARVDAVAAKVGRPAILTELGYPSSGSVWVEPWREERGGESRPAEQARAFAAMLDALRSARSIGAFLVWKYESDPGRTEPAGYLPKGKPAEAVIESYLKRK